MRRDPFIMFTPAKKFIGTVKIAWQAALRMI